MAMISPLLFFWLVLAGGRRLLGRNKRSHRHWSPLVLALFVGFAQAEEEPTLSREEKAAQAKIEELTKQNRHKEALDLLDGIIQKEREAASVRLGSTDLITKLKQSDAKYLKDLIKANPSNPTYRKRLAKLLYDLGRTEEAIQEWKKLAEQKPPDPEAMLQLGWAYLRLNRVQEAERLANILRPLDPNNTAFTKFIAHVDLERGRYGQAAELAQRSLKIDPNNKDTSLVLAKALMRQGNRKKAMEILEGLMRAYPENPSIRYEIADALITSGRAEDSLPILNVLVKADPSNTTYRKRRAQVLYDLGRTEEATAERRLLALETPTNTEVQMQLGWGYMGAKNFDEAYKIAERLIQIDPNNPKFLRFMAAVEIERKNFNESVKWAHAALRIHPGDRDSSIILARGLLQQRREGEAFNVLNNLIKTKNVNPSVWMHMGYLLGHMGKYDESLAYFEKLHKTDPANVDWRRHRADALYQVGRFDDAVAEWRDLARQKPPDARSIRRLADDAFYRKDWKEFLAWVHELSEIEVLEAFVWSRVAAAHMALNDTPQAVAAADRYIEANPSNLEGHLFKAELMEGLPDWAAAKRINEYVLTRNPNNRRAWDALARIAAETGDFQEAIRIQRVLQERYLVAYPYAAIREASWHAEAGQTEVAMKILQQFTKERPQVIVSLLYHGISPVERSDSISVANFRAHMKALKKAGYHPITVSELEPFYKKGKPLPKKPILITFDDARIDAFRHADPILEELGFKATMFVHLSALDNFPFHAGPEELRSWATNGRWEIQSHSSQGHEAVQVDPAGRTGRFFSNRKWLPEEYRLESVAEYKARVDNDYRESKALLEKEFPKSKIIAFAFPYGEYGQEGSVNVPNAMQINREMVKKYFDFCFVQGPYGYNMAKSKPTELTRFEPPLGMTGDQLINHLSEMEPWVQAKMGEARVWLAREQPLRALKIVRRLEREGIKGPELTAQKGIIMDGMGRPQEARKLYALASAKAPTKERYQRLLKRAERRAGPSLSTVYGTFSDNSDRENSRTSFRVGAPVGPVQVFGTFGRETYLERNVPFTNGTAGALELRWMPFSLATLQASYGQRSLQGDVERKFDLYSGMISMSLLPQIRGSYEQERSNIESAQAILADIRLDRRTATLEWDSNFNTTLSLASDRMNYSDQNSRKDLRFELVRGLTDWLSVGYNFWYAHTMEMRVEYWTPQKLKQHMGFLAVEETIGPMTGRLRYGRGYGYEALNARSVQSFMVGLDWRLNEYFSFIYNTTYNRSPVYISNRINFGISLRY